MALILKDNEIFNPPFGISYGFDLTSADYYAVIDRIEFDKGEKECSFIVVFYANKAEREKKSTATHREIFQINGDEVGNGGLTIGVRDCTTR